MDAPVADGATTRWWPAIRPVDGIGIAVLAAFAAWVWWASRVQDVDGGPLIKLIVACGIVAALARWMTFFHGTAVPGLLAAGVLTYVLVTGDDGPEGIGPDASVEALGALYTVGLGAAALVVLRARALWARLIFATVAIALAIVIWRTGSVGAIVIGATVLVAALALLVLPMEERRWVVVWPAFIAILVLFGSLTYAALPLPAGLVFGQPEPSRLAGWSAGLDAITDAPLYGIGLGSDIADRQPGAAAGARGTVGHEPLQIMAETGLVGGVLLLALLWWVLAWVARPGGGPGSVVAAVVIAGSVAHACLEPIWYVPMVPLTLAALAGTASMRGGDAAWRLARLRAILAHGVDGPAEGREDDGEDAGTSRVSNHG